MARPLLRWRPVKQSPLRGPIPTGFSTTARLGFFGGIKGSLSYPVGKGIAVGWVNVYSASATLPNYISGNIIFLVGSGSYSITLPPANTVAAGTGYTFSATGPGTVNIVPGGTDGIDLAPVVLRTNDRYHVISDGSGTWH